MGPGVCEYQLAWANIGGRRFDTPINPLLELGVLRPRYPGVSRACIKIRIPQPEPIMDEILKQLGGLVLGSVPTMVLFLLLVVAYGLLVRRPLAAVLAERYARTSGAMEKAHEAISAVEAKTAAYEERLRKAKAEIFAAREQRVKQWNAEHDEALAQARGVTAERVKAVRAEIEQSVAVARQQIEGMSAELSAQIVRAVIPAGIRPGATQ